MMLPVQIIGLLQSQLNRMEAAYTKSLEESVHCRLQLTTLEQEILHLKELCSQYEDEQSTQPPNEANDKQGAMLLAKIVSLPPVLQTCNWIIFAEAAGRRAGRPVKGGHSTRARKPGAREIYQRNGERGWIGRWEVDGAVSLHLAVFILTIFSTFPMLGFPQ